MGNAKSQILGVLLGACTLGPGCWQPPKPTPRQLDRGLLWMFPGINGREWFSDAYRGLRDGGVDAAVRMHDWNGVEILTNLTDLERNRRDAREVAEQVASYAAENPGRPIDLLGYSGGGGMVIMVAEALPPEVRLRHLVLAQPAVSPDYDLRPALQRIDGKLINFYCETDWVILGAGTWVFGTMDRKHVASAGKEGFDLDRAVDDSTLRKRVEQRAWSWQMFTSGHVGGHLGMGTYAWNRDYVAPILKASPGPSAAHDFAEGHALAHAGPAPAP